MTAIRQVKAAEGVEDLDVHRDATRIEMRTFEMRKPGDGRRGGADRVGVEPALDGSRRQLQDLPAQ